MIAQSRVEQGREDHDVARVAGIFARRQSAVVLRIDQLSLMSLKSRRRTKRGYVLKPRIAGCGGADLRYGKTVSKADL